MPNEVPWKFEAGTMPIAEATGLGAAVDYLERAGDGRGARARDSHLTAYALEALAQRFGDRITIHGPRDLDVRGGIISFMFDGIHAHDISQVARRGRRVRTRQPPLREAAHAGARRPRDHPCVVLRLQRRS